MTADQLFIVFIKFPSTTQEARQLLNVVMVCICVDVRMCVYLCVCDVVCTSYACIVCRMYDEDLRIALQEWKGLMKLNK